LIQDRSFALALRIVELYKLLVDQREFVIARQLLRSGTSIGANVEEASAAQSRRDFLSKMSIASKEARETVYWLKLLTHSRLVALDIGPYMTEAEEVMRILTAIVKTTSSTPEQT